MKKVLYFEGAGWADADSSKATDMNNCRVRTAFTNDSGKKIYLELTSLILNDKERKKRFPVFNIAVGFIDACFYITGDHNDQNKNSIIHRNNKAIEYNRANVLKFVNSLGCSFDKVITLPDLAGYRVHADKGGYNYGDEFVYSEELTKRAEQIYKYFYELEQSEGKRHPNFSLWVDENDRARLHLLRHFNGYNKHWTIKNAESWQDTITDSTLGKYGY